MLPLHEGTVTITATITSTGWLPDAATTIIRDVRTLTNVVTRVRPKSFKLRRIYLREWRVFRGMTQEQLAERLDTTKATISCYEHFGEGDKGRQPGLGTLQALADVLDCTVADLISHDPKEPNSPWPIWDRLTPGRRLDAIEMLQGLLRSQERAA